MVRLTTDAGSAARLPAQFLALNQQLRGSGDTRSAMQGLVALAVAGVPGCRTAAITAWPWNGRPYSTAASDRVAARIDQLQYRVGEGPCLFTAANGGYVYAADLARDNRWPAFSAAARAQTSLRGVMSFHLGDEPFRTALNLYADEVGTFDDQAVAVGVLFAAHAQVLLMHADSAARAVQLTAALGTSRIIGAAVGILMSSHQLTVDQAFDLLRVASQQLNRKLRDVAVDVADTGSLPVGAH